MTFGGEVNLVSLFAGVGGFDLAATRAGVRVVAAVEIDPAARGVLADRFPDVTLFNDVREVSGADLGAAGFVPDRGIITAGWPCQGNSVAGRRGGMDDPRSGLWTEVVRLLAETRPRWFVGENVPGLHSVNGGADLALVRADLAQLGYWWAERILDAQHFGVPQRRRRVFFVGCARDGAAAVEVLLEPESSRRHPAPGRAARPRAAAVAALSASGGGADDNDATGGPLIAGPLQATGAGGRGHRVDAEGAATGHLVVRALTTRAGSALDDQQTFQLVPVVFDAAQITHPENRVNPQPGDPATPLVPVSGRSVRRLTPTECERLQGFPDGWTATSGGRAQSESPRYRQLGNAVAVPVAEWILRRLVAVDARLGRRV